MLKRIGKRLKDQRGLTLVELLAVVVILGIIAAIAVPSIGNIVEKSRYDAAKSEALQAIAAAKLYVAGEGPTTDNKYSQTLLSDYLETTGYWDTIEVTYDPATKAYTFTGTAKTGKFTNVPEIDGETEAEIKELKYNKTTTTP